MRKRNLVFPLVVGSLFMPSIEALERTTDLNSLENENIIYEEVDILIAEGGGGGKKTQQQLKKQEENKKANQQRARERNAAKEEEKKAKNTTEPVVKVDKEKLITELKKVVNSNNVSLFNDVKENINQMPELLIENETAPYPLIPFFRCGRLTKKALEAKENNNLKKANTYANLAIRSVIREKNILGKQGPQIKEKSIDPKSLTNIEYSLLGINSIILDDYKNGNRYIKKALESETQDTSKLKSLIAYTGIINGEIAQGCSDLKELIIDGTIDLADLDIIPIEDICRIPNY